MASEIWEVLRGNDIYTVNDGSISYLLQAQNIGAPAKRNIAVRGPQQHGNSIIDFRYDPRVINLIYGFEAESRLEADTRRDQIYNIWKGVQGTPVQLRITRRDGLVRQIDGEVVNVLDMPNTRADRIGPQQRLGVQLECGDPFWYNPVEQTFSFDTSSLTDWWLALGTINPVNVFDHQETPGANQTIQGSSIPNSSPFTVAVQIDTTAPGSLENVFLLIQGGGVTDGEWGGGTNRIALVGNDIDSIWADGDHTYFFVTNGASATGYRDNASIDTENNIIGVNPATSQWRSSNSGRTPLTAGLEKAALYDIALDSTQRTALQAAMTGISSSDQLNYAGSWRTYPIVTITGPITDPIVRNETTGDKLDFTGIVIPDGTFYVIDCRYGYKTVQDHTGANKIADLTDDSDLATFHIAPAPEVLAGGNVLSLNGTSTSGNTLVTIEYHERYLGL